VAITITSQQAVHGFLTARRYDGAVYDIWPVSVCLSVHKSLSKSKR